MSGGKRNTLFTGLMAILFFWMFLGQLVNFHQEHVLGKYLPAQSTQFINPKTDDDIIAQYDEEKLLVVFIDQDAISECCAYFNKLLPTVIEFVNLAEPEEELLIHQHISSLPPPVC
jgi:hypothetical protein